MKLINKFIGMTYTLAVSSLLANSAYAEERVLKVTNWGEYIAEDTIKNFEHRSMSKNGLSNFDNFIFFIKNNYEKKEVLAVLKKHKIGTKNLPDAIKWHCAFYWKHIFNKKELDLFILIFLK